MGKYFKYAIGEIILVVIGILIALQINNWNEQKKVHSKEVETLKEFQKALGFDIAQMDSIILQYDRALTSLKIIKKHLSNRLPYHDSLAKHFFNTTLIYDSGGMTTGVYETLKSSGLDLISNKEIRDNIILIYDEQNPWMKSWEKRYTDELFDAHKSLYKTRFEDFWGGNHKDPSIIGTMKPIDYDKLQLDKEYAYHVNTQMNLIGWLIKKPVENTRSNCRKLLELINKELQND